jgi:hypothetical protein
MMQQQERRNGGCSGVAWSVPDAGLGNGSLLLYKGLLYIFGGRGEISCVNAVSGKEVYKTRLTEGRCHLGIALGL